MTPPREERRRSPRSRAERPCKVYVPRTGKYLAGRTGDLSEHGLLLLLDRPVHLHAGEEVWLGVAPADGRGLLLADELQPGRITRALLTTDGRTGVGVETRGDSRPDGGALRRAA